MTVSEDEFLFEELFGRRLCPFVNFMVTDKLPSIDGLFF